jgi:hypothetical protein
MGTWACYTYPKNFGIVIKYMLICPLFFRVIWARFEVAERDLLLQHRSFACHLTAAE